MLDTRQYFLSVIRENSEQKRAPLSPPDFWPGSFNPEVEGSQTTPTKPRAITSMCGLKTGRIFKMRHANTGTVALSEQNFRAVQLSVDEEVAFLERAISRNQSRALYEQLSPCFYIL
jgi:hypothetical protein